MSERARVREERAQVAVTRRGVVSHRPVCGYLGAQRSTKGNREEDDDDAGWSFFSRYEESENVATTHKGRKEGGRVVWRVIVFGEHGRNVTSRKMWRVCVGVFVCAFVSS